MLSHFSWRSARPIFAVMAALFYSVCGASSAQAAVSLVENGVARTTIVLPPEPSRDEAHAAKELQDHIALISGVRLDVVTQGQSLQGRSPILVGRAAPETLAAAIRQKSQDQSAFALNVGNGQVALRGLSDGLQTPLETDYATFAKALEDELSKNGGRTVKGGQYPLGTRNAAYELLEQLGVRWFMPGELGTVIPRAQTVSLNDQQTIQVPSFASRRMSQIFNDQWEQRLRHGGQNFPSSHGIPGVGHSDLFEQHPEYYSLNNGVRTKRQVCVSNPEVVKIATEATKEFFRKNPSENMIGMGANDGRGFCECPNCRALDGGDYDQFGGEISMTDRYVWFFNQVLEGIEDEFPDKRIGFYAYSVYNRPPVKWKADQGIVPAVALITLCRIHGVGNPICPEKSYQKEIVQKWGEIVPEVYDRGYWFNLADPGLPFFMIRRIADEVPIGKELGIAGWRVESVYNWTGETPSLYLAGKLMWNHEADVQAILADFYTKFFGPAAQPMQVYIEMMDSAVYRADYHAGSSWDAPKIYNAAVRNTARAALVEAKKLAPAGSEYAQRVEVYSKHFDYLEAFVKMMETRVVHDYASSMEALEQIDILRKDLQERPQPLMNRQAEPYMARFFRPTTEQGYARTTGGNRMVAPLENNWQFQIDPEKVGIAINLWRPENVGGNWQTVEPYTTTWSDLGLRYYKGHSWYRQTVNIPAQFEGQRIFLWFGGVDEKARVWVNGKLIGEGSGAFKPFELDATPAVRAGQPNVVVVQAINDGLNELGTGGIVAPVMFYAPAAGQDAVPQGGIPPTQQDLETIAGN